jgi:maltoporin
LLRVRRLSLVAFVAVLAVLAGGGSAHAQDAAATVATPVPPPATTGAGAAQPGPAMRPSNVVTSDTSAPSVPGAETSAVARGNEAARVVQEKPSQHEGSFEFGSYGRVWAAWDLRGATGRGTNVVAFGPRLVDEGNYGELELRREDKFDEKVRSRIVATVALFPPFFHFSGRPDNAIGVRNLYAQGTYDRVTLWAGSRMYRGDDIYLLNWWPLDNQNTVGGGVGGSVFKSDRYETIAQVHVGQQRLDNPFQYQQVPVVAPFGFGTVDVTKLDRPRTVETLKLTQFVRAPGGPGGFKVVLYGELHQLSAGVFRDPLINQDRGLPSDTGWLAGSQLSAWTGQNDSYVSLFMRHARGIAAYDPLSVPITFALDRTVSGASETQIALAGNYQTEAFSVLAATYVRFFRDGSPSETSTQKYDEGAIVARPSVFLGERFGISVEGSYQQRRIAIVRPEDDGPLTASVAKLGVMPYFSPSGKGSFKRPQIRLLYNASFRDSGARGLYPKEDVFSQRSVEHYAGIGAEWWFNSSSYP